ncbi:MAG: hypothetical protein ACI9VR_004696 [Cognaticolwellia sp.]|jgi:hypothetical protein
MWSVCLIEGVLVAWGRRCLASLEQVALARSTCRPTLDLRWARRFSRPAPAQLAAPPDRPRAHVASSAGQRLDGLRWLGPAPHRGVEGLADPPVGVFEHRAVVRQRIPSVRQSLARRDGCSPWACARPTRHRRPAASLAAPGSSLGPRRPQLSSRSAEAALEGPSGSKGRGGS